MAEGQSGSLEERARAEVFTNGGDTFWLLADGRSPVDALREVELKVAKLVQVAGWAQASRNFASGANGNGDVAHGPQATVIEVKRSERARLRDWWAQVADDAEQARALPVLAYRWSNGPWLAVTELEELLALLALRERA